MTVNRKYNSDKKESGTRNMTDSRARELLERYFEGESSLEEEEQLRTYFSSQQVAGDLECYSELFRHFAGQRKAFIEVPETKEKPGSHIRKIRFVSLKGIGIGATATLAAALTAVAVFLSVPETGRQDNPPKIVFAGEDGQTQSAIDIAERGLRMFCNAATGIEETTARTLSAFAGNMEESISFGNTNCAVE